MADAGIKVLPLRCATWVLAKIVVRRRFHSMGKYSSWYDVQQIDDSLTFRSMEASEDAEGIEMWLKRDIYMLMALTMNAGVPKPSPEKMSFHVRRATKQRNIVFGVSGPVGRRQEYRGADFGRFGLRNMLWQDGYGQKVLPSQICNKKDNTRERYLTARKHTKDSWPYCKRDVFCSRDSVYRKFSLRFRVEIILPAQIRNSSDMPQYCGSRQANKKTGNRDISMLC